MKQRRVERVERRRPAVDLNMAGDGKTGVLPGRAPKGFFAALKRLFGRRR